MAALAENFDLLDFLSVWFANLDPWVSNTPDELKGFPSWTSAPLSARSDWQPEEQDRSQAIFHGVRQVADFTRTFPPAAAQIS